METIRFLVQGSATEPYRVTFEKDGSNLSAYCTCPAGQNGQYCKHRFSLLLGDSDGVVSNNSGDAAKVAAWLPGTDVAEAMQRLAELEDALERAKQQVAQAKRRVAEAMRR